ncbi:hypothetical protein D3C76_1704330 [compost metagenome]
MFSEVLISSGSASWSPIFWRGFSEAYGLWNTICTSRRSCLRSALLAPVTSVPAICSEPEEGSSIKVRARARVDLPQPDSPTTARVLPASSSNDTPLSARTRA